MIFMEHEVYICYEKVDKITADAICHVLEENNIKCWIKPRDLGVHHEVEEIMESIRKSKLVVLVYSNSSKKSNFVNTEIDMAFSYNLPILVFNIDNSNLDGSLEFFLTGEHWLDAYPNPSVEFENLIKDSCKLLEKPIPSSIITSEKSLKEEKTKHTPKKDLYFLKKYKLPIISIGILLFISIIGFSLMETNNSGFTIQITNVSYSNDSGEYDSFNYSYIINGIILYNQDNITGYTIQSEFYDGSGKLLDTDNKNLFEVPTGQTNNLGGGFTANNNVTKAIVKIKDNNNQTICTEEYPINI